MEDESTYSIVRFYAQGHPRVIVAEGLSLEEAQEHCQDPETSSRTCTGTEAVAHTEQYGDWFDGYTEE